jgi:hypothetical protein
MIFQREGETLNEAIKRQCAERGHDFYRSHRCWNCNIPFSEVEKLIIVSPRKPQPERESFSEVDYTFAEGRHFQ